MSCLIWKGNSYTFWTVSGVKPCLKILAFSIFMIVNDTYAMSHRLKKFTPKLALAQCNFYRQQNGVATRLCINIFLSVEESNLFHIA